MLRTILDKDIQGHKVQKLAIYGASIYAGYEMVKYSYWIYRNCQIKAKSKKLRDSKLNKTHQFAKVDQEELILSLDVTGLREELLKGTFTSVDLVNVFGNRCQTIGRDLCLSAEENFEEAQEIAKICDAQRLEAIQKNEAEKLPPMHGIPISVKELFEQKGKVVTVGCEFLSEQRFTEDAPALRLFKEAGAILLVRGNVPQLAYSLHSENHVWGTAKNPFQNNRSCGGSSGGDGGLVGSKCVPFALGSDIGGSIRIPALFNGVYGFKPTNWRVTTKGHRCALDNNFTQFTQIHATIGPLGRSVNDLKLSMEVLLNPRVNRYDPFQAPTVFRQELYQNALDKKVKIGYCGNLTTMPVTQAVERAFNISKKALEDDGYELVPFEITPEETKTARNIMAGLLVNKMIGPLFDTLERNYEEPLDCYKISGKVLKASSFTRGALKYLLRITGNQRVVDGIQNVRPMSESELDGLIMQQSQLQISMLKKWQDAGIEALLIPVFPTCSFQAKYAGDMGVFLDYVSIWSVLHYPQGVVPVTEVLESETKEYQDTYNDLWTDFMKKDLEGATGMPVGVSVVSLPWEDETALGIMKALENKIQFQKTQQN
eukprot:403343571